jgi:hypothetical protein
MGHTGQKRQVDAVIVPGTPVGRDPCEFSRSLWGSFPDKPCGHPATSSELLRSCAYPERHSRCPGRGNITPVGPETDVGGGV